MKKTLLPVILCFVAIWTAQAQDFLSPDFIPQPKTPETAEFSKHIAVPVSLHTGTPEISIPLYTLSYGGIEVPISLSYDATGVKVNELSSEVGLKWNLNVGGTLTRQMKGGPDEGFSPTSNMSIVPASGFYEDYGFSKVANFFDTSYSIDQRNKFLTDLASGSKDMEPDMFAFNAFGHTGRFYFNANRKLISFTGDDYKYELLENIRGTQEIGFKTWRVTTPSGLQLIFGNELFAIERSYSYDVTAPRINEFEEQAWKLTKITNPATNKSIRFLYNRSTYEDASISNKSWATRVTTQNGTALQCGDSNFDPTLLYGGELSRNTNAIRTQLSGSISEIQKPELSKITAGDIEVRFIRSTRSDVIHRNSSSIPTRIDEIQVLYRGNCVKKIKLSYVYTTASSTSITSLETGFIAPAFKEMARKRMFLTSVSEVSCDGSIAPKVHSFNYDRGSQLPSRLSFGKDHWGFYNGQTSNQILYPQIGNSGTFSQQANRDVSINHGTIGTLSSITYPTKGRTQFTYESHRAITNPTPVTTARWERVLDLNDSESGTFVYRGPVYNQPNSGQKITVQVKGFGTYPGEITNPCTCENYDANFYNAIAYEIVDVATNAVALRGEFAGVASLTRDKINCDPDKRYDFGISDLGLLTRTIDLSNDLVDGRTYRVNVYDYNGANGGRCGQTSALVEEYVVNTTTPAPEGFSVGGLRVASISYQDDNATTVKTDTYTYSDPKLIYTPQYAHSLCYDIDLTLGGLMDIYQGANELPGNWDIALYYTDSAFLFISPEDNLFELNFTGSHIAYGTVEQRNSEGYTRYTYANPKNYLEASGYSAKRYFPFAPVFQSGYAGKLLSKRVYSDTDEVLMSENYTYTINTTPLDQQERALRVRNLPIYNLTGASTVWYRIPNEVVQLKEKNTTELLGGKNVVQKETYQYESDFHLMPTTTTVTTSANEQRINKQQYPPDVFPTTHPLNQQHRIASPVVTERYIQPSGSSTPTLLTTEETAYSTDTATAQLTLPTVLHTAKGTSTKEPRVRFERYDEEGNLLQYRKENGVPTSFIWSYDGMYPVAKVENATFAELALAVGRSVSQLQNLSTIDLGILAQLRTNLPNAMVTTYTYKPLVGISQITDPRGYTTTYEYDGFNRLAFIKDIDAYLLSEYKYHYKN